MVSKASDDLPDPLTPVTMISVPTGSVRSMFLRLCVRAPRTTMFWASAAPATGISDMLVLRPCSCEFDGDSNHQSYRRVVMLASRPELSRSVDPAGLVEVQPGVPRIQAGRIAVTEIHQ